jgi:small subunit ribosomal protein S17
MVRSLIGKVVSAAMQKSVTVSVERSFRHPVLPKVIRQHRKFMAHDESDALSVGDLVRIRECRPLSRHKHFIVDEVLQKVKTA